MTVKEMIEKVAREIYGCHLSDNLMGEYIDLHEDIKERLRECALSVLLTLNLIQKCPECVEDVSEELGLDKPLEVYSIHCTCHKGCIATEDTLRKALRTISQLPDGIPGCEYCISSQRIADQALKEYEGEESK